MDLKMIVAVSILVVGVFLIFKDQLSLLFKSASTTVKQNTNISAVQQTQQKQVNFADLEGLVKSLDSTKDSEEINFLIDKLGPKLIRKRLGQ